ncbi:MAG: ABC transporter permease [Ilumatobacteraceae bacterium]
MLRLILRRLLIMIPVLFLVSVLVFSLVLLVPGDPASTLAGESATQEQIDATRVRLGLNDPVLVQYGRWVGGAVHGDLGKSLFTSQSVTEAIVQRMPVTLSLTAGAVVLSLLFGVPAGIFSAVFRRRWPDRLIGIGAASALAMPNYLVGMLLVLYVAIWHSWLPATGFVPLTQDPWKWFQHLILPWITLGLASSAVITRQLRSSLIGVLGQDYVRTALGQGVAVAHGDPQALDQERVDPGGDDPRDADRVPAWWLRRRRAGVRARRHRRSSRSARCRSGTSR